VKSELATFFDAFPNGSVWSNDIDGRGYDVLLSGYEGDARIDVDALADRLQRADHAYVVQSLGEVGFTSLFELLGTYAGRATDLGPWLADAEINRDRNLRLMYIAGMGANLYQQEFIYDNMLSYRRFPSDFFVGSEARVGILRALMTP
jgi:spermidine synthase